MCDSRIDQSEVPTHGTLALIGSVHAKTHANNRDPVVSRIADTGCTLDIGPILESQRKDRASAGHASDAGIVVYDCRGNASASCPVITSRPPIGKHGSEVYARVTKPQVRMREITTFIEDANNYGGISSDDLPGRRSLHLVHSPLLGKQWVIRRSSAWHDHWHCLQSHFRKQIAPLLQSVQELVRVDLLRILHSEITKRRHVATARLIFFQTKIAEVLFRLCIGSCLRDAHEQSIWQRTYQSLITLDSRESVYRTHPLSTVTQLILDRTSVRR
jgi:hypothetical protein